MFVKISEETSLNIVFKKDKCKDCFKLFKNNPSRCRFKEFETFAIKLCLKGNRVKISERYQVGIEQNNNTR